MPPLPTMPRKRIDFVVVGTQRSGTTTLDAMLRSLPGVLMPRRKELHFFDDDRNFPPDRAPDYDLYQSQWDYDWKDGPDGLVLGEVTPCYMYWPPAIPRLKAYHPGLKIICTLRNPVERTFSEWNMGVKRRRERLSFELATRYERRRLEIESNPLHWAYVDRSRYPVQIERIRAAFPPEQVLFLRFEELSHDPAGTCARVARFIGLEAATPKPDLHLNAFRYDGAMHPATGRRLLMELEGDIRRTGEMLGWDVNPWLVPHGSTPAWFLGEIQRRTVNLARSIRRLLTGRGQPGAGRPGDRPTPFPPRAPFGSPARSGKS